MYSIVVSTVSSLAFSARLHVPQCSLHSRKSKETRGVKMFSTKTRRDVGMVLCVSEEHVCLHGKTNWWKNSRNKKGYHSMLTNRGEHSATSYVKDTLDTSPRRRRKSGKRRRRVLHDGALALASKVSTGYCTVPLPHKRCLSPVLTSVQE